MSLEIIGVTVNGMTGSPNAANHRAPQSQPSTARREELKQQEKLAEPEKIGKSIQEIEQLSSYFNRRLKFSINRELGEVVVKVIDGETDKVIKVLPPEALQRLHERIREAVGLLFDVTI